MTKPTDSATTGALKALNEVLSEIGMPRGETGSGKPSVEGIAAQMPAVARATAVETLANMQPRMANAALEASCKRVLGSPPDWRKENVVNGSQGFVRESFQRALLPPGDVTELANIAARLCVPLPAQEIARKLTRLKVMTAGRKDGETDTEAQIMAYVEELQEWPADLVVKVIHPSNWKWFPAWSQIEDEMIFWGGDKRRALIRAINERLVEQQSNERSNER